MYPSINIPVLDLFIVVIAYCYIHSLHQNYLSFTRSGRSVEPSHVASFWELSKHFYRQPLGVLSSSSAVVVFDGVCEASSMSTTAVAFFAASRFAIVSFYRHQLAVIISAARFSLPSISQRSIEAPSKINCDAISSSELKRDLLGKHFLIFGARQRPRWKNWTQEAQLSVFSFLQKSPSQFRPWAMRSRKVPGTAPEQWCAHRHSLYYVFTNWHKN